MGIALDISAQEIALQLLESTAAALKSHDFAHFAEAFHIPHSISTFDRKKHVRTRSEMKAVFDKIAAHYTAMGVSDLVRTCVEAEYKTRDRIETSYVSNLMSGDHRLKPAYPCFTIIEKHNGVWAISACSYALDPSSTQAHVLQLSSRMVKAGHLANTTGGLNAQG